jgi:hypothetical protein
MDKCSICDINIIEKSKFLTYIEEPKDFFILKLKKNKLVLEKDKKICLRCFDKKNNIK